MGGIAILIPAAGASRRMRGIDKLLQQVDGLPLLRRQVLRACAVADHVTVTLPDADHPRAAALSGLGVQLVEVPDSDLGMSASIRRGVAFLPRSLDAVMIVPADMPEISEDDLRSIIKGFRSEAHATLQQGTSQDGQPGHPVLFPADCIPSLMSLNGDRGARAVIDANRHRLRHVALPDDHALTDLDTPEAWAAWRGAEPALP
ncbi:nucleotidyltransferase family protein [Thalassococcus sp. CAU 1522]|uniref:Nucleotidyltransferase family protein n=1 Tax=Thalassococcus arenae TaxID=2851652 RepID=A0ABS6N9Y9_9RHOB|nr:nucleotidyltransferase family protein [Thalassococcus arenae]MBV2360822.1 nucleotidyltransferase family protein [Thalassococcus arenae]